MRVSSFSLNSPKHISRKRRFSRPLLLSARCCVPLGMWNSSPRRAAFLSLPIVTNPEPAMMRQNSSRFACVCRLNFFPAFTVIILTVVGSLSVNCSNDPQGRVSVMCVRVSIIYFQSLYDTPARAGIKMGVQRISSCDMLRPFRTGSFYVRRGRDSNSRCLTARWFSKPLH